MSNKSFPVFLIDLDSVLIDPRGYRKSIQAALGYFTNQMGLGDLYPGEDAIARFEAINMTCEWDITPILLAAIFDGLLRENPQILLPANLEDACQTIRTHKVNAPQVDLARITSILAAHFKPGMEYAALALDLNQDGVENPPFPHLVGQPLTSSILADTRMIDGALTTKIFQHFTLGSERYEKLSGLPRFFESDSYLQKHDQLLLNEDARDALLKAWHENKVGIVIYTARPSLPVKGDVVSFNYSPEAEVALEALGLSELPLVAAGKMGWLATGMGIRVDQLTKPSPVQAMAGISAAVTRKVESSLWAAARLFFNHENNGYRDFPSLSIHVFEDAGGNIKAVRKAAELLGEAGVQNEVTAWGISENPEKQQALLQANAFLLPDVNQAIQKAFVIEGIN